MKVTLSEIKKNPQGTNREGKEVGIPVNDVEHKEEINIQPGQKEEKRILKNENRLRNLWENFKCTNIRIIGMQEGEEEQQEIENLFQKIMKENFPNFVKKVDIYIQVQEAQRVPNELDPMRTTMRHIVIKMPKVKDRILKAATEK